MSGAMNRRILVICAFLVFTLGARAYLAVPAKVPPRQPLQEFAQAWDGWRMTGESRVEDDVEEVMKADDYLLRRYQDPAGDVADLFVAYYVTQKAGESMHSPKNCLPGAGWLPVVNDTVVMTKSPSGKVLRINRYVIEKGGERALVLYWYQSGERVIASEYWGKVYLVWDAMRTGRRDGAIVRILIPLQKGQSEEDATRLGLEFARGAYLRLPPFLPA
jgi:EpsI family protein